MMKFSSIGEIILLGNETGCLDLDTQDDRYLACGIPSSLVERGLKRYLTVAKRRQEDKCT